MSSYPEVIKMLIKKYFPFIFRKHGHFCDTVDLIDENGEYTEAGRNISQQIISFSEKDVIPVGGQDWASFSGYCNVFCELGYKVSSSCCMQDKDGNTTYSAVLVRKDSVA